METKLLILLVSLLLALYGYHLIVMKSKNKLIKELEEKNRKLFFDLRDCYDVIKRGKDATPLIPSDLNLVNKDLENAELVRSTYHKLVLCNARNLRPQ